MRVWTRNDILGLAAVGATLLVGLSAFFVPEVRYLLRLERRPLPVPQSQQTSSPLPSPPAPVAAQSNESPAVYGEPANTIAEVRNRHHVAPMREAESGETLSEVPPGSFGFAYAVLVVHLSESPEKIPLDAHGTFMDLEMHKLADGHSEVVAYVGPETLERLRHGLRPGEQLTVYTKAWKDAPNLVAIPFPRIQCQRDRMLEPDKRDQLYAVDCRAR